MAYAAGVPFEVISAGIKAFRAVEHRIEYADIEGLMKHGED